MSWHMPGLHTYVHNMKSVKVPPAIKVLSDDWEPHYENDPLIAPHWDVLTREKVVSIGDKEYVLYQGKI